MPESVKPITLSNPLTLTICGAIAMLLGMAALPALGVDKFTSGTIRVWAFASSLVGLLLWFWAIGLGVTGQLWGILLSGRNAYSLSRLQMAGWTWLVLAALAAATMCNVWGVGHTVDPANALSIDINDNLLIVMGISFASGAAVPGILSLKAQGDDATNQELQGVQQRMDETGVQTQGRVVSRTDGINASLADIVQGDEVANAGIVDLSKVQQLLVTLLLWIVFAAMAFHSFGYDFATTRVDTLPILGEKMVWLLGLSHAGYIAYKAVPKAGGAGVTSADGTVANSGIAPSATINLDRPAATAGAPPPSPTDPRVAQG